MLDDIWIRRVHSGHYGVLRLSPIAGLECRCDDLSARTCGIPFLAKDMHFPVGGKRHRICKPILRPARHPLDRRHRRTVQERFAAERNDADVPFFSLARPRQPLSPIPGKIHQKFQHIEVRWRRMGRTRIVQGKRLHGASRIADGGGCMRGPRRNRQIQPVDVADVGMPDRFEAARSQNPFALRARRAKLDGHDRIPGENLAKSAGYVAAFGHVRIAKRPNAVARRIG
ncbi:MAG: hypothetical protein ABSB70_23945 [Candidatus Velthaea sp.]